MRITLIIVAVVCLLVTMGLGGILAGRNINDASDIEKLTKKNSKLLKLATALGSKDAKKVTDIQEKTGALRIGAGALAVLVLASLALFIMLFMKKGITILTGSVILLAVLSIFLNPHYETGAYGPASARSVAIAVGIFAIIGALASFGADQLRMRRAGKVA